MTYRKSIVLKSGATCILRSASASDGEAVFEIFNQTHAETDFLLSYPDENSFTPRKNQLSYGRLPKAATK